MYYANNFADVAQRNVLSGTAGSSLQFFVQWRYVHFPFTPSGTRLHPFNYRVTSCLQFYSRGHYYNIYSINSY